MDSPSHHYKHIPHPRIAERKSDHPVKVSDQLDASNAFARFNSWLGLKITTIVGTMICAYLFFFLAAYGLPTALKGGPSSLVLWCSSEFLQLCLLPIIIVGQNIQSKASDKRSEQTYKDAEAILHECLELQKHLEAQDNSLDDVIKHLAK